MPHVRYYQPTVGIKKFVVFDVGSYIKISAGSQGLGNEKTTRSPANSHLFNRPTCQGGMPDYRNPKNLLQLL